MWNFLTLEPAVMKSDFRGKRTGLRQVGSGAFTGALRSELKLGPADRKVNSKSLDLPIVPPSSFPTFIHGWKIFTHLVLMISAHHLPPALLPNEELHKDYNATF